MQIRKLLQNLAVVVLMSAFHSNSKFALAEDYISPELVKIDTPVIKPESADFTPMLGTYNYSVSWEGIPAADIVTTVEQDGAYFKVTASAKTYSGIDLIYKLRYKAQSLISTSDFYPHKTTIDHRENSRHKFTEIKFDPEGKTVDTIRIDYKKDEVKTLTFDPENFMLDPFGAAFLARSVNWELGTTRHFDTFNGKSRYLISLTAEEKTTLEVDGVTKDVWVISPKVINLSLPEQSGKLKNAQIYVTADKARDIAMIKSSVFIGSVYTELESIKPSPTQFINARFAANNKIPPVVSKQ